MLPAHPRPALPARLIGTRPAIHVEPVVIDLPPVNANEARAFHAFTVRPASSHLAVKQTTLLHLHHHLPRRHGGSKEKQQQQQRRRRQQGQKSCSTLTQFLLPAHLHPPKPVALHPPASRHTSETASASTTPPRRLMLLPVSKRSSSWPTRHRVI